MRELQRPVKRVVAQVTDRPSWPVRVTVGAIRIYQLTVSALIGRQCRYLPSCSDYAAEAVRLHGPWPGLWMASARLCRCQPWGAWGYDPVPLRCDPIAPWRPWRCGRWRMPAGGDDQDRASNSAANP